MQMKDDFLSSLVFEPRESLEIEVKAWLDLDDNRHKAALAKEIIALANHGGGYLVVGFKQAEDGSFAAAPERPTDLRAWSGDSVQAVIAKYADPAIQCQVRHVQSATGESYPIIVVPGGHRIPVRAKAGSPDGRLTANRVYIRRPGPNSEEPRTATDWDELFERCLRNRKDDLLTAMRSIMDGEIPRTATNSPARSEELADFVRAAISRWERLVSDFPTNSVLRFPDGYYDHAFAIDGRLDRRSVRELWNIVQSSVRDHTGWPAFLTINRVPFKPIPIDGAIDCWIGPDSDGSVKRPDLHDYWSASPDGFLFTRRGYPEDSDFEQDAHGRAFDLVMPVRRLAESILEASYIAAALKATDANLICHCRWTGLSGRTLVSRRGGGPTLRLYGQQHCILQDEYVVSEQVALSALPDALPELVFNMLAPLYELFDFFRLEKRLVESEVLALRRNQF